MLFSVYLRILPASGTATVGVHSLADRAVYLVMPVLSLTLVTIGSELRYVRSAMTEVLRQDFIRTAAAKGVSRRRLLYGHALRNAMRKFADHPLVGEVRGIGLIGGIEIVKDKKTKESFDPKLAVGPYAVGRAQAHGLITRSLGDTLALCPPLIINDAQIGDLLGRYAKALDDTQAWLGQQGLSAG